MAQRACHGSVAAFALIDANVKPAVWLQAGSVSLLLESASNGKVRQYIIQFGAVLVLAVCLCGHVSEIFDHWDKTLQTGNDVDYSAVVVVVIAGAVFILAHAASGVSEHAS